MRVAVVTCTGQRWELFNLCQRWIGRQTRQPDVRIVATDTWECPPPGSSTHNIYVGPPPVGYVTRATEKATWSLICALQAVPEGHAAIIMEDDDWYSPFHIETCMREIEAGKKVVFGDTVVRYHVPAARWSGESQGACDAVEGTVGLHPEAIGRFVDSLRTDTNWNDGGRGIYRGFTTVGIKGVGHGLPGRAGATTKHRADHYKTVRMQADPGHANLRRLLGNEDAEAYISLVKQ